LPRAITKTNIFIYIKEKKKKKRGKPITIIGIKRNKRGHRRMNDKRDTF
jgi:hypothetical protein